MKKCRCKKQVAIKVIFQNGKLMESTPLSLCYKELLYQRIYQRYSKKERNYR